jgi:hypothetical protein
MLLGILLLISGLTISAVAIYYSVLGLASIFAAAVIPIYIMGTTLEISKLVAASWLKANWHRTPILLKSYMTIAVIILMFITSMGIFGFLSQAHSDQSLVSGDVQSKIAIYDEQIKTAKENIDANRKALKQMDEAVDQVMARSSSETGADKAVAIRRAQQKERARLQSEIAAEQKTIAALGQERAPIAAEVRKVEAEVGPIKYIAAFIYGEDTDANMLEKAVTWVIILLVIVFDPLAVVMLLAAQMSFQWYRQDKQNLEKNTPVPYVADVGEKPTEEDLKDDLFPTYEEITPTEDKLTPNPLSQGFEWDTVSPLAEKTQADQAPLDKSETVESEKSLLEQHPYLTAGFKHFENLKPMVHKEPEPVKEEPNTTVDEVVAEVERPGDYLILPELEEESKKKTYMIKHQGQQIVKDKE